MFLKTHLAREAFLHSGLDTACDIHITVPWCRSWLQSQFQLCADAHHERQWVMAWECRYLLSTWETYTEYLVPVFSLTQTHLLKAFEEWNNRGTVCLSLPFTHILSSPAFQIDKWNIFRPYLPSSEVPFVVTTMEKRALGLEAHAFHLSLLEVIFMQHDLKQHQLSKCFWQ